MEPNNFGTTDGGMLTSLSCVEGYFLVVSLQEKLVRILFTTQVRDLVIPELKLLYTPVPWKFYVHSDKHPARRKKATRRRLVRSVQTVHRLEQNGSAIQCQSCGGCVMTNIKTRLSLSRATTKPTIFTVSHSPSSTYTSTRRLTFFISPC